jgi:hypothetical protein
MRRLFEGGGYFNVQPCQGRLLFKGGHYSRAAFTQGNTVNTIIQGQYHALTILNHSTVDINLLHIILTDYCYNS